MPWIRQGINDTRTSLFAMEGPPEKMAAYFLRAYGPEFSRHYMDAMIGGLAGEEPPSSYWRQVKVEVERAIVKNESEAL